MADGVSTYPRNTPYAPATSNSRRHGNTSNNARWPKEETTWPSGHRRKPEHNTLDGARPRHRQMRSVLEGQTRETAKPAGGAATPPAPPAQPQREEPTVDATE